MTWLRDLFNIATATGFRPRVKQLKLELQNGVTRMISGAWMMLGFVAVVILKSSLFRYPSCTIPFSSSGTEYPKWVVGAYGKHVKGWTQIRIYYHIISGKLILMVIIQESANADTLLHFR